MWDTDETIVAVASAAGGASRGIVRASGPKVIECITPHFRPTNNDVKLVDVQDARRLSGSLSLPTLRHPLDVDLLLWPTARSFTRQPTAELHTVGSPPLLSAIAEALCSTGARLARPGEFTLRAFLAGRFDLTQAEAVLGVIDAGDRRQLDLALAQMAGGLAGPLNALRDKLLDVLAHLEAGLDFVDEDIEFIEPAKLVNELESARTAVNDLSRRITSRTLADDLVRIVLYGRPNAGKSSLFNAIIGQGEAIVSEIPGTTRDWLTARIDLDGVSCELIDTAGLDEAAALHTIDRRAQAEASERREQAHVGVYCIDASDPHDDSTTARPNDLVIWTKADLVTSAQGRDYLLTSATSGFGLDTLRVRLREAAITARWGDAEVVAGTAARVQPLLHAAGDALREALELARRREGEELVAAELRLALESLGEVVGAVYTDDILDRIFSRFCIGK